MSKDPEKVEPVRTDLVTTVTPADTAAVWEVYDQVFADASYGAWLESAWGRHTARTGFRLARAFVGPRLVGFGYGYTGERGQFWSDAAASVLGEELAASWVGGHFEVVTLGVLPDHRRSGRAAALLSELAADLPHERWLLMTTADPDDPARRLYGRAGWDVLGPGLSPDRVIMARENRP